MANQRKKYKILGGIKVSSEQLSEWGSSGGRPQLYSSNAERARAFRLRRKQEKFGKEAKLRGWRSYKPIASFIRLICPNCHSKSISGPQHLGQQCYSCHQGSMVEEWGRERGESSGEKNEKLRGGRKKTI